MCGVKGRHVFGEAVGIAFADERMDFPINARNGQGFRLALTIQGRDYEFPGATPSRQSNFKNDLRGSGPFLHDDPSDRPARIYAGRTTVHTGGDRSSWLRLPVIAPHGAE